jgi:hypothetical protein
MIAYIIKMFSIKVSKKETVTILPLSKLAPIRVKDCEFEKTHLGCYIRLTIQTSKLDIAVNMNCLDDDQRMVPVSVYNFSFKGRPFHHYFYPGRVFFVKEPFYKIAIDGRDLIRVDDPSDVEFETQ